ncbi:MULTISPECIES: nitrous oxide reductase family maturation protein NosD [Haloferax]|uniref:Carbohydrate-binding/sugar hydrolysis domain-containing protein n=2 Tax=Haloferax TaxID=2251 RepID=A0A6G1Z389_9EURY|nr:MULTISPECIES: right-handed parallel beta-helix repeat-containing protein [Haloferax]KAB1188259.1 hypothetical protein Hfx1149_09570 [Haloferax sp. CBA1149]MRW80945.1 hypothetical protein [Haloferax marinisediminis]
MSADYLDSARRFSRRDVLRKGAVATAVAGLGLSGFAGSAAAGDDGKNGDTVPDDAIPIDGPTVITEPGYYVLTQDITVKDVSEVIVVEEGVSDVTIDGRGYRMKGPRNDGYSDTTAIRAGLYLSDDVVDVTAKDIVITGFGTGIEYSDNRNGTISNVKITHCEVALRLYNVKELTIADNVIAKNDIVFFQDEGTRTVHILRNRITRNEDVGGFYFAATLLIRNNRFDYNNGALSMLYTYDSKIVDNLFYQNDAGLSYSDSVGTSVNGSGDVIRGNRFIENDRYGISVEEDSRDVLIEENDIFRNGTDGIRLVGRVLRCTVSKNRIIGNGSDGIFLENADENELVGNLIRQNGGDGIELRSSEFNDLGSDNNVVRNNIIRENGDLPIRIDENSVGNVVEDNQIGDDAPDTCRLDSY